MTYLIKAIVCFGLVAAIFCLFQFVIEPEQTAKNKKKQAIKTTFPPIEYISGEGFFEN